MSDQNLSWQDVCRELLRLDAEGHEKPWEEFEVITAPKQVWRQAINLKTLITYAEEGWSIRLKPRTVRVTTHSGETLELPEPWCDESSGVEVFVLHGDGCIVTSAACRSASYVRAGSAFRTESDAQAWAAAMPKIRGAS